MDARFLGSTVLAAAIDVMPRSATNTLDLGRGRRVGVAILGTPVLAANAVKVASVRFGPSGTEALALSTAICDVNGDGVSDVSLVFRVADTGIVCGTTVVRLTGSTLTGEPFQGVDSAATPGCP